MTTTTTTMDDSLGKDGYPDLLDTSKGMVYIKDSHTTLYHDHNTANHIWIVEFSVKIDNKNVVVTAAKDTYSRSTLNMPKRYNGYQFSPFVRYVDRLGKWYYMDDDTLIKAVDENNKELLKELLKYEVNYSKTVLTGIITKLIERDSSMGGGGVSSGKKKGIE